MSAPRVGLLALALALGIPATGVGQAVRAAGAPGTYQVVAVRAPVSLSADRNVTFQVLPDGTAPVLGRLHGELAAGSDADRVVVLTVGVPAAARAGRQEVARVRFSGAAGSAIEVPVEVDVARVRRASLVVAQALFATRVGGRVALRYRLTNTGNAVDSFSVRATGPARWPAVPARGYVLQAGTLAEAEVTLTVPRGASTGSSPVQFVVSNGAGEMTRARATVEVVDDGPRRGEQAWLVTPGVATVLGDTAPARPVFGLDLEGPVANSVRLYGHLVQSAGLDAAHLWGLARVGYFPGTSFLSLTGPRWRLTGGHTTQTFSDVTGANFWGSGAAFSYTDPRWSAATLLGAPVIASAGTANGGSGHLLGTQFGFDVGGGWVRGTATDAIEAIPGGRELRALGVGATSPPLYAGTLVSAELAQRWFAAGQGLGWLAEAKRVGDDGTSLFLRYTHAPGGSAAFAPARDMLTVYGARRLAAGIALNAGLWAARDTSPAFNRLASSGWSVAPQFALTEWATLEVEARSSRFEATDTLGTFGNSETDGRVGLTARLGRLLGTGSATVGRATRTTAFAGGGSIAPSADHVELSGAVQWASPGGVLGATADYQQNGPGVGFVPRQYSVGLRVDAVPLPGYGAALLDAGVQRYDWFGARPGATVVRLGLRAPVPGTLVVRLDAEHNPLFLAAASSGWNFVLKLERPIVVRARPATMAGMVYEDLNANGRRDAGEPAVTGALVRRGGESVITDANGGFRFFRQTDVPAELDESSLPFGLVASPANQPLRGERRVEIGVTPTAPVVVHLVLTVPQGEPAPRVDLRGAAVYARDADGNVWSARADSSGTAVFHALPPGQYRIDLDLTGLKEPLLIRGELPGFGVEAGREVPALTIPLYPRPIRFSPQRPGGPGRS